MQGVLETLLVLFAMREEPCLCCLQCAQAHVNPYNSGLLAGEALVRFDWTPSP